MREQYLYTIAQACAKLAISRASLYRLINNHEIACIKIGRSSRISEQALERFVSARTKAVYDAWS
jgi:excisionase family DNA binding protein